jgi:hypothetical protein
VHEHEHEYDHVHDGPNTYTCTLDVNVHDRSGTSKRQRAAALEVVGCRGAELPRDVCDRGATDEKRARGRPDCTYTYS